MSVYKELSQGGGFNLPFLIHIRDMKSSFNLYLINDNKDFNYNGITYEASNFTYTPNPEGDSNLSIELCGHSEIINIIENNVLLNIDIIGVFNGETVENLGQFKHRYGEGSWDGKTLDLKLNKDDRGSMTFPALTFNSYNNRGNA